MVEGKGAGMGPPMNKDNVKVKDDIVGGMEGSQDRFGDGQLDDKARVTWEGEESKSDMVGEGAAKHVHADGQIERCSTDCGLSVQDLVRRSATPSCRAYAARRRLSNIVIRMKRQPRTRKESALKASTYTNPLLPRKKKQRGARTNQSHSAAKTAVRTLTRQQAVTVSSQ